MMPKRLIFDFETRSACDLKKAGAYRYSVDPTTEPTCLAVKFVGRSERYFLRFEEVNQSWKDVSPIFKDGWMAALIDKYEFSAHNLFFDRCIYENILVKRFNWPQIPERQYRC